MMKQRIAVVVACWAALVASAVTAAQAQTERIVLPRGPAPDQTVHARMTQDMTVSIEPDPGPSGGVPASSAIGAMTLAMKMAMAQTLKIGPLDDRKQFDGAVTIDEATTEMTMNGMAMPMPGGMPLKAGQQFTVHYDADRVLTDVAGDFPDAAKEFVKNALGGVMRSIPTTPIAVGDTVTVPLSLPLPNMPTGPLGDISGDSSLTLKEIARDGSARVATLVLTFSAKIAPASNAAAPVTIDMRIAGSGTMLYDLERGIARSSDQTGTIDGSMSMGASMPALKMHGTITLTSRVTDP